jgi:hypothetical protein
LEYYWRTIIHKILGNIIGIIGNIIGTIGNTIVTIGEYDWGTPPIIHGLLGK